MLARESCPGFVVAERVDCGARGVCECGPPPSHLGSGTGRLHWVPWRREDASGHAPSLCFGRRDALQGAASEALEVLAVNWGRLPGWQVAHSANSRRVLPPASRSLSPRPARSLSGHCPKTKIILFSSANLPPTFPSSQETAKLRVLIHAHTHLEPSYKLVVLYIRSVPQEGTTCFFP